MRTSNTDIKKVSIQFKNPILAPVVKKEPQVTKKNKNHKFVTKVSLDDDAMIKLKRVFFLMHRCRILAKQFLSSNKDISLNELQALVQKNLTKEQLTHVMSSIIKREVYYMHKERNNINDVDMNPNSINFYEESSINNRFVINYRRNRVFIEDLNIVLTLGRRLPEFKEEEKFYLNVCVDDTSNIGYVFINVFFKK